MEFLQRLWGAKSAIVSSTRELVDPNADQSNLLCVIEALEARVNELEANYQKMNIDLRNRRNEINTLEYKNTLLAREKHGIFKALYGLNLSDFVDKHKGERCFVVGNGPSLNNIDMRKLQNEITLGSNRAFVGFEDWGFHYDYWMVQDRILAEQSAKEFQTALPDDIVKFIPFTLLKFFDKKYTYNVVPFCMDYTKQCSFSNDPEALHEGFTVTIGLLQLAAIMGFKEIILVGVDHNYPIPDGNISGDRKWNGRGLVTHFSDKYSNYENGQVWELPNIEKMTRAYEAASEWARNNGVRMLNATPGTKLDAFEKVQFDALF